MTVTLTIGQPGLTLNKGSTFIVSSTDGEIDARQAQGVFAADTRFVSGYRLRLNGQPWELVSAAAVSHDVAHIYRTNPILHTFAGETVAGGTLSLTLVRSIDEGIREHYEITNYARQSVSIVLELEVQSDFGDLFEVKAGAVRQRENLLTQWDAESLELVTTYQHEDFSRRFTYKVVEVDRAPWYANGRLSFPVRLEPGATWRAYGHMLLQDDNPASAAGSASADNGRLTTDRLDRLHEQWLSCCTAVSTPNHDVHQSYRQSVEDMDALRLDTQELGPDLWVPAAGVPWFVTLFGRDSLVASLQNMMVHARVAEGTLRTLAQYQATERDDWRDAQPGKIVHEIRHGELAHFNRVPHTRYYGTWDATPLFLIALHQAWRWLGDRALIEDLLPTAERCLDWIDHDGDLDGDGFQEYQTYSASGYENMAWKDAHDAVVYPDGSQVTQPKALCELQGYVYAAKSGMAEIYNALGRNDQADALSTEAADLKQRFNAAFWMPEEGTYAFGLDASKRPIRTVASNAGHCLWSGIADDDKAAQVVARLLAPDMWSGWGIRTLSTENPAYDPFSYQRGSVWPHDNAIIAAGMKRYGFAAAANQVARGMFDAASYFESYRLPEVFAGLARAPQSFPVQYRGANIPQAWAAGSVFELLRTMLGLEADAPHGRLVVNPTLPDWLPTLSLTGLSVGDAMLNLRFWREGPVSRYADDTQDGGTVGVVAGLMPPIPIPR